MSQQSRRTLTAVPAALVPVVVVPVAAGSVGTSPSAVPTVLADLRRVTPLRPAASDALPAVVTRAGRRLEVALHGEIDLGVKPELDRAVELLGELAAAGSPATAVHVDLSGVPFLDSTGLTFLLRVHALAAERRLALRVSGGRPGITRLLELSGVRARLAEGTQPALAA